MMKIDSLTPMLRTWDLDGTIDFYTSMLGFDCQAFEADWGWAIVSCGGSSIMFSSPNEHEGDTEPAFTGSLYFRVQDVDEVWLRVRESARICYPVENFDYGMRGFAIYDNSYLLQFGEPVVGD